MSRVNFFTAVMCVFIASRFAGGQAIGPADGKEIVDLEAAWNQAHLKGDADVLDSIWSADLIVTVPDMPPFSKAELLRMWRTTKVSFTRYETSDVKMRLYDGAAVVTGRLRRSRNFGGRARDEDWLFTKTYVRVGRLWKVVAYHASPTPAGYGDGT